MVSFGGRVLCLFCVFSFGGLGFSGLLVFCVVVLIVVRGVFVVALVWGFVNFS